MTTLTNHTPPPIEAVIETAIYATDLGAAESFYANVLGLPVVGREAGHHVFFFVGTANVLLVFNPDATLAGEMLPPHGTRGPGHFALGVPVGSRTRGGIIWWCSALLSRRRCRGRAAGGRFTFATRRGTWWSWSRGACGAHRRGGEGQRRARAE